jgi:hypothetical protein
MSKIYKITNPDDSITYKKKPIKKNCNPQTEHSLCPKFGLDVKIY